ncbi:MAG: hypothetical protein JNL85_02745 [Rubrivivax sp.]|nr:hypothetical protein [Rubrivivax sp.]
MSVVFTRRAASARILAVSAAAAAAAVAAGCATQGSVPDIFASREPMAASRDEIWFVYLETGKTGFADRAAQEAMQRGHIANFQRLFGEKKLFAAGPLKDPSEFKRGIVVVKAPSLQVLAEYFQPDQYVREGYLKLDAVPALVNKPLATEGIDSSAIEEGRIVQLLRPERAPAPAEAQAQRAAIRRLVEQGTFGAWYTLEAGPVSEVLFTRSKDDKALWAAVGALPPAGGPAKADVWPQWFARGVLK